MVSFLKSAIEFFLGMILLSVASVVTITLIASNIEMQNARKAHTAYVMEIENSNLAPSVIEECKKDAQDKYTLYVGNPKGADGSKVVKVALTYRTDIPLFGIEEEHVIEGFAAQ